MFFCQFPNELQNIRFLIIRINIDNLVSFLITLNTKYYVKNKYQFKN